MSIVINRNAQVKQKQKRPKKTLSKAKTVKASFSDLPKKRLIIPELYNGYNHNIKAVNKHDNIASCNAGLKPIVKEDHQAIEHWLFCVLLVNSYLLSLCSDLKSHRKVNFQSQQDF
jgi:hypothetical protein